MVGNVTPVLEKLNDEDRKTYLSVYCSLCHELSRRYGSFARFLLSYDMVFLALLEDGLNGRLYIGDEKKCVAGILGKKRKIFSSAGVKYAADASVILAYFKILDNLKDEKLLGKLKNLLVLPYIFLKYQKVKKNRPALANSIEERQKGQRDAETRFKSLDDRAFATEEMTKSLVLKGTVYDDKMSLGRFGFFLGRVIYILDAIKDYRQDEKNGSFNPFLKGRNSPQEARRECYMALGEAVHRLDKLKFLQNKDIIYNIICLGLPRQIKHYGETKNGQIL